MSYSATVLDLELGPNRDCGGFLWYPKNVGMNRTSIYYGSQKLPHFMDIQHISQSVFLSLNIHSF